MATREARIMEVVSMLIEMHGTDAVHVARGEMEKLRAGKTMITLSLCGTWSPVRQASCSYFWKREVAEMFNKKWGRRSTEQPPSCNIPHEKRY